MARFRQVEVLWNMIFKLSRARVISIYDMVRREGQGVGIHRIPD